LQKGIQYYRQYNSPIFSCFLDASRASHLIHYWSPFLVVWLLCISYNWQECCEHSGTSTLVYFRTSTGFPRGPILFPRLFSMYIDDLSTLLSASQVGYYIDSTCVESRFYADFLCLLATSATDLRNLIDVCRQYGVVDDIV